MNRDRRLSLWIGILMASLIPIILASGVFAKQPAVLEGEMTAPSPDFEFTTLSGERITKEALKGKPTLLMFWATWCGICRDELPRIHELDTQAKSMGLQIVAIAFSDDKNAVKKYVKEHKSAFSFPTVFDADNKVAMRFRVRATPTFFLLDGNGDILLMHIGGGILGNTTFRRLMHELLT